MASAFFRLGRCVVLFLGERDLWRSSVRLGLQGVLLSPTSIFSIEIGKDRCSVCLFTLLCLYFLLSGMTRREEKDTSFMAFLLFRGSHIVESSFEFVPPFDHHRALSCERDRWRTWVGKEFIFGLHRSISRFFPGFFSFSPCRAGGIDCVLKGSHIITRKEPVYFYFIEIWANFPLSLFFLFCSFISGTEESTVHSGNLFF